MLGTIKRVKVDKGFGFISTAQGDHFFHRRDLRDGVIFDETLTEMRVEFVPIGTDKGPAARDVRPAAE